MRSASSRTRKSISLRRCRQGCASSLMKSHNLPGVPTTISGLQSSMRFYLSLEIPPTIAPTRTRCWLCLLMALMCYSICIASSRVGAIISARRRFSQGILFASRRSSSCNISESIGRPNAKVLPEPVCEAIIKSLQCLKLNNVRLCTSVGASNLPSESDYRTLSCNTS